MKKVETIKKMIEKLNKENPGTVTLNPPISIDKVREFEEKYKITLPKEYVEFITLVGDGGKIQPSPQRSEAEIIALGRYESDGYPLEKIGMPFPLKKGWMPDFGDTIENTEDVDEDTLEQITGEHWEKIETQGNIVVMADDESSWRLIVNGERKGEVWQLSEYGIQRLIKCNFLRMLELYLSGGLMEFTIECRDEEYPQEPDLTKQCKKVIKKLRIEMNPPIDITEIQEFEKRHNILLPKEYVTFLTEIGNGGKKTPWCVEKIYSLSELDSLDNLAQPFLIQTEEDYKRIYFKENGKWRLFGMDVEKEKSIWDFLYHKKDYGKKAEKSPWILPQFELLNGCIPIIGRTFTADRTIKWQYLLVLNGNYKGQIWRVDENRLKLIDGTPEFPINALSIIEAIAYGGR